MRTYDDLHDAETRVTDGSTGGQKGAKLTQLGALDPVALIEVSRVAGFGANKYAAFNYLKGYDWALSFNAMQRHALLFWAGEDTDEESGQLHAAMAAWHALALVSFVARGIGTDTRPPRLETSPGDAAEAILTAVQRHEMSADIATRLLSGEIPGVDFAFCGDHVVGDDPECCGPDSTFVAMA